MSHSLPALQENALAAADAFCQRFIPPPKRKRQKPVLLNKQTGPESQHAKAKAGSFYRPRNHEASPFFKVVRQRFDEFEKVYPQRYQERYGYWRPVIRSSIDKFLKPVVSLSNHAATLKRGLPAYAAPIAKRSFS
jgi:hypothetical protein